MKLHTCTTCEHGREREHKSYCRKEKCYSHLTKCIQNKALASFIALDQLPDRCGKAVGAAVPAREGVL